MRCASSTNACIADAKTRAKESGTDPEFREIVRHAREMHFLLHEVLLVNEALSNAYYRGLSESTNNAIEQLRSPTHGGFLATVLEGRP